MKIPTRNTLGTKIKLEQYAEGMHWCSHHKNYEPIENFGALASGTFGLDHICKEAKSIKNAKRTSEYQKQYTSKPNAAWIGPFEEGIYKIIDVRNNKVVYIGSSNRISYRYYDHFGGGGIRHCFLKRAITNEERNYYKFVFWIELETNAKTRKELEYFLIQKYQPQFNIAGK